MDDQTSVIDPEMAEIRSRMLSDKDDGNSQRPRKESTERVTPKGPKDRPPSEAHSSATSKPATKELSLSAITQFERDPRERPQRSSSMDGIHRSSKEGPVTTGITTSDDFLLIERPPQAHVKPENTPGGSNKPKEGLLARLTGGGTQRTDPKDWPPEVIVEFQRRDEMFHQMKAYIDRLEERIQSQDQEISALNTALADTEHKLDLTRQDLNASRAFVSSEGTADAQNLIKSLREINSTIDDFAFRLMQEILPDVATSRQVSRQGLEGMAKAYAGASRISVFINTAYSRHATVGDFVHPFICYAVCTRLLDLVFQPFVPGMPREESDIFQAIYGFVHQNEPQERSARWRAITYSHAHRGRNDKAFCQRAADDLILKLTNAINPLLAPEAVTFDKVKEELGDVVRSIFEDAVKLQDKARTGYMSFDYAPFMPPLDQPYHPMYMETAQDVRQGAKGKNSNAILTVGMGMQAWKSVVKEDKSVGKDVSIAVKATVICGNWNPSA